MRNYIGIIRDHSASMSPNRRAAARDYNLNVDNILHASITENLDTLVTTVKCGVGYRGGVEVETINSSPTSILPISEHSYKADGPATPLFASVGKLIEIFENSDQQDASFLVMAITDGEENASGPLGWPTHRLTQAIERLQNTGRWTFAFRVPRGYATKLARLGIPVGNILEWELTEAGLHQATEVTTRSMKTYYSNLARGIKSTDKFFVSADHLDTRQLNQSLENINNEVKVWENRFSSRDIKSISESVLRTPYKIGTVFYQLTKTETVQPKKKIAIQDKMTGAVYSGYNARQLLGIPDNQYIKVVPGNHSKYDIFVQSTSVNRKVLPNTKLMYWNRAI